jgi:GNAT superfamily N-acetyltransferase
MVAINEKDIIGVSAGIIASRSTYHLKLLFVHSNFQNQGVATFLLNAFETKGIENGYSLLTTNYQKWAVWSLNFYLKHGYKEYEDKDELLFDELMDSENKLKMIGRFNTRYKRYLWKKI